MGIFHQKQCVFFCMQHWNYEVSCNLWHLWFVFRCFLCWQMLAGTSASPHLGHHLEKPLVAKFEVSSLRLTACFARRLQGLWQGDLPNQRVTLARARRLHRLADGFQFSRILIREFHSGYEITPLNLWLETMIHIFCLQVVGGNTTVCC